MTPDLTAVRLTDAGGRLLIVGPSLGTSASALWQRCADRLAGEFDVVGWELPGHGTGTPAAGPYVVADLAAGVLDLAARVSAERGRPGEAFEYAGVSLGGCVGLQLLLDAPDRITAATLLCTGARIGDEAMWADRIAQTRAGGTAGLVDATVHRWFAPGFPDREPDVTADLLQALRDVPDESYVHACGALAAFDVTGELSRITTPLTAVAGGADPVTPPAGLRFIAERTGGRFVELADVAHLAPAEAPDAVAALIRGRQRTAAERRTAGFAERRAVVGDEHVDRAVEATTDLTADFQDFITRTAWGEVWTRPGLSRRERSLITLTALVAGGHHEELALHLRAARRNGLTDAEIGECLLQAAIYCGVPASNTAFRIAQQVLDGE